MLKLVDWLLILIGWFWIQGNFFSPSCVCRSGPVFCKFSVISVLLNTSSRIRLEYQLILATIEKYSFSY
jgi:hypothetical protein